MKTAISNLRVNFAVLLLMVAVSSLSAAQTAHAFLWTQSSGMQDIGTIPGWTTSAGYAINRDGELVGSDSNSIGKLASFRWTQSTGALRLSLGTEYNYAAGVNTSDEVVGGYYGTDHHRHSYYWSCLIGWVNIGNLGGAETTATAINSSGQVVGYSATATGPFNGFSWTFAGGMQGLGTLPGGKSSSALAINDYGVIVGYADEAQGEVQAVMWRNGKIQSLGMLGSGRDAFSKATGVNKEGQVVGCSTTTDGTIHAFLWSVSGGMQDLGTLSAGDNSFALGINGSGEVVGYSQSASTTNAFIWTTTNGMQNLGTLGGNFAQAYAINDAGQVTGYSTLP
jgi:probable HAF family extracellular repeat protein